MNSINNIMTKWARFVLPAFCLSALTGCLSDADELTPDPSAPVSLQIRLVAEQEGDLNDTRATEAGTDGEYMSDEICVLIVNCGTQAVTKKFLPTDELQHDAAAQAGNLREWSSEAFTLRPGDYDVYAFANWSTAENTQLNSFVGVGVNVSLPELENNTGIDIRNIVLDDPASKLDFDNASISSRRFIPMSGYVEKVHVTAATRSIDVGLDRLVSKVRVQVDLSAFEDAGVRPRQLTFSNVADRIGLFREQDAVQDIQRDKTYTVDLSDLQPVSGMSNVYLVPDFYVNATEGAGDQPFTVTLTTDQFGGTVYEASTQRTDMERNAILPINLTFNDYVPQLDMQAWLAPIGSFPVPVVVQWDDSYVVEVPEGCQFSFSADGLAGNGLENVTCQWTIPEEAQNVAAIETGSNGTTVKGHVTAQAGLQFPLQLYIQWDEGDRHYARTYPITVQVKDMFSFYWLNALSVGYMRQLFPESVQILIKK